MPQLHKSAKLKKMGVAFGSSTHKNKLRKKGRRAHRSQDPTEGLQVANPNAAAIDIGSREHWVAVPPGRALVCVRKFGCFTADLESLADWLGQCNATKGE